MERSDIVSLLMVLFQVGIAIVVGSQDGSEAWRYVQVRPKAHMFWWYSWFAISADTNTYQPSRNRNGGDRYDTNPRIADITISMTTCSDSVNIGLFESGASGVGFGCIMLVNNHISIHAVFQTEMGFSYRFFLDYPVETCYNFVKNVKNTTLFVKTDVEAAKDGTKFLIEFFNRNETLQKSPLYIVAESYGGKFAITLALSALKLSY
ncbi:serine carboxypeptidase-like 51 [Coffea eugenioides]|uniref:serine carboxypeptidase-like 51 n=1 Tax=Coffea eugenioides TaxID=49369 RepID=UPI000F610053|nr:serine carboxypeptidase-like 51 [Coffea eugenioides]